MQSTSPYVLNIVEEINRIRLNCRLVLKHIPTSCNPADLASRRVAAKVVLKSNLWLHGSAWLINISAYPDQSRFPTEWEMIACPIRLLPPQTERFFHFPSLDKAVRSYAALLHLTRWWAEHKFPHLVHRFPRRPLTAIIRVSQGASYPQILRQLQGKTALLTPDERAFIGQRNPYIDNNGVLRGRSRLSDEPPEFGYMDPILLESHCALWRLIVEHWHEVLLHCNTSTLLVHLRKEFWVPRMRQQVKKILRLCIHFKRVQGQPYPTPPLAPVHPNRLNAEVPFRVIGLNYTGSFKIHRSHVDMVYVLLFICAATRVVALETTNSLTVVELVQGIRRFAD
ncbi:uncharacterized protein [Palaemon carinicauda]|uniref:uncharacterized protein n=1 Tax=Palaemon carinicauda TaxID=392227 RepID=UPI0035B5CFD0